MALIDSGLGATVYVWGRNITPVRPGIFSQSAVFVAADGLPYKWKIDWDLLRLVRNDGSHTPVAFFDPGSLGILSRPKPATLSVTPEGLPILDDIVATWVYMEQRRRRRRNQASTSARISHSSRIAASI